MATPLRSRIRKPVARTQHQATWSPPRLSEKELNKELASAGTATSIGSGFSRDAMFGDRKEGRQSSQLATAATELCRFLISSSTLRVLPKDAQHVCHYAAIVIWSYTEFFIGKVEDAKEGEVLKAIDALFTARPVKPTDDVGTPEKVDKPKGVAHRTIDDTEAIITTDIYRLTAQAMKLRSGVWAQGGRTAMAERLRELESEVQDMRRENRNLRMQLGRSVSSPGSESQDTEGDSDYKSAIGTGTSVNEMSRGWLDSPDADADSDSASPPAPAPAVLLYPGQAAGVWLRTWGLSRLFPWMRFVSMLRIVFWVVLVQTFVAVRRERHMWMNANGLTRDHFLRYSVGVWTPLGIHLPAVDYSFAWGRTDAETMLAALVDVLSWATMWVSRVWSHLVSKYAEAAG